MITFNVTFNLQHEIFWDKNEDYPGIWSHGRLLRLSTGSGLSFWPTFQETICSLSSCPDDNEQLVPRNINQYERLDPVVRPINLPCTFLTFPNFCNGSVFAWLTRMKIQKILWILIYECVLVIIIVVNFKKFTKLTSTLFGAGQFGCKYLLSQEESSL
jgi:hypothetical protein